jgi:hypothetical protein
MDPSKLGFVQELYKVIEERFPHGRQITTALTALAVLTAILVMVSIILSTLYPIVSTSASYIASVVIALIRNQPMPQLALRLQNPFFRQSLATTIILLYLIFLIVESEYTQKRNKTNFERLEARIVELEGAMSKPQPG